MILKRFYDEGLAQAGYLLGCAATGEALAVDVNRDLDPILQAADSEDLRIAHVTETHIHADFLSGSRELAERTGATLYLSAEGGPDWQYTFASEAGASLVRDGDTIKVGNLEVKALHTPGHTPEHLTFLVTDVPATREPIGVFTGDFVFVGDVGRPDLLERAASLAGTMEPGARDLFRSLQRFKTLPYHLQIWPAHGAGSACGKSLGGVPQSVLAYEKLANWAFQILDEDEFVRAILAGQPEPPFYFAEMKRRNKLGPERRSVSGVGSWVSAPGIQQIGETLGRGDLVIDTRGAEAFAAAHIPGAINIPLNRGFVNWAGWLIPYDRPFFVLVEDEAGRIQVDRNLALIGLEAYARYVPAAVVDEWRMAGQPLQWFARIPESEAPSVLNGARPPFILDVRGKSEYDSHHVPGAVNFPLGHLRSHLSEIPKDRPIVVYCQAGNRSPIGASILQAAGFEQVADLRGGFESWKPPSKP